MDITFHNSENPHGTVPSCHKLLELDMEKKTMKFDGYYTIEDHDLPVKLFMFLAKDPVVYIINIIAVRRTRVHEDKFVDDDEFGRICLFPTWIIELDFEVMSVL
jgi:hypothetical protein